MDEDNIFDDEDNIFDEEQAREFANFLEQKALKPDNNPYSLHNCLKDILAFLFDGGAAKK